MSVDFSAIKSIGIDSGSLFLKVVGLDEDERIQFSVYCPHKGEPVKCLDEIFRNVPLRGKVEVNVTGKTAAPIAASLGLETADEIGATISGVRRYAAGAVNIIDIGSGSLSLIRLNDNGEFLGYTTNSLCAAGTGSFLDEQSERLGLKYEMLSELRHIEFPPPIATRCAVFAKSDLVHRQQEGCTRDEMWSGLCKGMVETVKNTLFKGRELRGKTVVIGGVIKNREFLKWLKLSLNTEIIIPEFHNLITAAGCALQPGERISADRFMLNGRVNGNGSDKEELARRPVLNLEKSVYPDFSVPEEYVDDAGTEVRIHYLCGELELPCYLGFDIGSTSTKVVIMDESEKVFADFYRKTAGDPIGAVKALCRAMSDLEEKKGMKFKVLGVGTTGSGRVLIGRVIGADVIKNEITAHVTGAMKFDSSIDTIFEIGGQDSKYIHTKNGYLHDANMNYICAAGTGSFVEEVARKLGFHVSEIGGSVLGVNPPVTTDRCTVFMEQDVAELLKKGFSREEVMAGVLYSIVQNYLTKVVGSRFYSRKKIFFQGATARNKGLVAAFEKLVGAEIVVSPYCHVMGAYGIALLTKRAMNGTSAAGGVSRFYGLRFKDCEVRIDKSRCELCENYCEITEAAAGDGRPVTWGYMCGRDGTEKLAKVHLKGYKPFRVMKRLMETDCAGGSHVRDEIAFDSADGGDKGENLNGSNRARLTVGIPDTLIHKFYLPFYRAFFGRLGAGMKISRSTDKEMIRQGIELSGADFCFPVKLAHAHVLDLVNDPEIDRVFLPFMINAGNSRHVTRRFFCPYIVSHATVIRSALEAKGADTERILSPVIDFRWDDRKLKRKFAEEMKEFGSANAILDAFEAGRKAMEDFRVCCEAEGRKILENLEKKNETGVVILGHPYNIYDAAANLNLIEKLAGLGVTVVPLDFLPLDEAELGSDFSNLFWETNKKITLAAKFVAGHKNLFSLCITNFSCGPDSFGLTYVEEIMQGKPMLILEVDDHGADAGIMTRLEAFVDVIQSHREGVVRKPYEIGNAAVKMSDFKERTILIPPIHPVGTNLFAAAFRGFGMKAAAMGVETRDDFEVGKRYCRGSECIPACSTIGKFITELEKGDIEKPALFMPTASGPCRFGQYSTLHRIILNRLGRDDVPIFSWSSENAYEGQGLKERRLLWNAILMSDILFKLRCKVKPYEKNPGETVKLFEASIRELEKGLEKGVVPLKEFKKVIAAFREIEIVKSVKPLVGIVGEIYVRCNPFSNQYIIEAIEEAGGEAWLAPISEWILYTSFVEANLYKGKFDITALLKNRFLKNDEEELYGMCGDILADRHEPSIEQNIEAGRAYFPLEFEGESILTIGRALKFIEQGVDFVINCSPFSCMHGNLTSAVFQQIEARLGVPVINVFYDGEREVNGIIRSVVRNKLRDVSGVHRTLGAGL